MTTPDPDRERLLGAFARTVAERGYPRTRPRDVAAAAGLSEAAFHARFADLDDCFLALYRHCTGLLRTRAEAAFRAAGTDWGAGFAAALDSALATIAARPEYARACVLDVSSAGPLVRRERVRFLSGLRAMLRGPGPGTLPDIVRDAIIGGLYGTVYARVAADRTQELPALSPALAGFALGYFAASDSRSRTGSSETSTGFGGASATTPDGQGAQASR